MIGTEQGLSIVEGNFSVRGEKVQTLWGRSFFKAASYMSYHFAGKGDEIQGGALNVVEEFVEHTQRIFDDERVAFRVFLQTGEGEPGSWSKLQPGQGMFGSPPWDQGMWDYQQLRNLCATDSRVKELTGLYANVLRFFFEHSQRTRCIYELVVDATMKHMDGLCTGVIDHCIRQTATYCRDLQETYPGACVILSARNEWDAHNGTRTSLTDVNMWSRRFYRWAREGPDGKETQYSYTQPQGSGWEAEQWPEGIIIVDHGGNDTFDYDVGPEPGKFKMGAIHPVRKNSGRDWRDAPNMEPLRRDSRRMPIGATESMYYVDRRDIGRAENWYRNPGGWHSNENDMMLMYENLRQAGFNYIIVHDEKGVQGDKSWPRPSTYLEEELTNYFGGHNPPPPPPGKVRYDRTIEAGYLQVLGRNPDAGGREHYNNLLHQFYVEGEVGLNESAFRDELLRSVEYREKNTDKRGGDR